MIRTKLALTSLALAIAIGLAGCTTEYEISEDEAARMLSSDQPFEVDGEPFSGRVIYREGDQINFTAELKDGRPHGVVESFHANGKKARRTELVWDDDKKDSVPEGEETRWNEDGVMIRRKVVSRGQDMRQERWCDNGDRKEVVEFKDGQRNELQEWDCDTGKQVVAVAYNSSGEPHGEQKAWAPDGTLIGHKILVAGKFDGLQQEWHANGKPQLKATFANGVATGRHEKWDETGKLIEAGDFSADGTKTGLWLEGYGEPKQVHYGPDGFIRPELAQGYIRALTSRPDAKAVEFWLKEGQVKVNDALPAAYNGDAAEGSFSFPVRHWTYPVVVADAPMLQMLVDQGADINQTDSEGTTRLMRCVDKFSATRSSYGRACLPEELERIVSLGGRANGVDMKGRSALHRILDISSSDDRNWGRPHAAAREARVAAVGHLVKAGADPNAADADGFTPLVHALKARRPDLVRTLLAAGARANTAGPDDSQAVHWLFLSAVDQYEIDPAFVRETLPTLVAAGADPKAPMTWNGAQVTLRELAARHALIDVVQMLDGA